ncbi:hypothetical protein ACJWDR_01745 [Streptomyces tauricus]|uniref:hypothetical protein n=1 Tax=Streptomyces tauricus TaxID=68274 RepID=UPI00387F09D4
MVTRRMLRRVTLTALALPLAVIAPASAGDSAGTTATVSAEGQGRTGRPVSVVDHVADFYGAYTDALYDTGHGRLTEALRRHYLTPGLRRTLTRWEAVHHRDGMLRSKGVPARWSVRYNDSGMGHCWTRVTLTWKDTGKRADTTRLMIQSDLATGQISDIRAVR